MGKRRVQGIEQLKISQVLLLPRLNGMISRSFTNTQLLVTSVIYTLSVSWQPLTWWIITPSVVHDEESITVTVLLLSVHTLHNASTQVPSLCLISPVSGARGRVRTVWLTAPSIGPDGPTSPRSLLRSCLSSYKWSAEATVVRVKVSVIIGEWTRNAHVLALIGRKRTTAPRNAAA